MEGGVIDGVQSHIDAVAGGEAIEDRLALIANSNWLTDEAKRVQSYFLKSFCWMAALDPLCGTTISLSGGLTLTLNRRREEITGHELPGVRTDSNGWLVIEGRFVQDGRRLPGYQGNCPLWPLMMRNVPARGAGPWQNFRPQVLEHLDYVGQSWPRQTLTA